METYGAESEGGYDPLQLVLGDVELSTDGGQSDRHSGAVRNLCAKTKTKTKYRQ